MPASVIAVQPGSRIEQLLASFGHLKAAAEEAVAQFEACKDAIKAEVTAAQAGTDYIVTAAPGFPSLMVSWRTQWRLDTKRLKEADPETYARYAVQSGRWELRELRP